MRWFDEKGGISKELVGPSAEPRWDFIYQLTSNGSTNCHVNGGWEVDLPKIPGPTEYTELIDSSFSA